MISLAEEGPVGTRLRQAGIPVSSCGARRARDVRALWRLYELLRAFSPDVVHSFLFHANVATRLVAPIAGIAPSRLISEIQTIEIERPWHLIVDNLTCRLCRYEVANSQAVLEHLRRRGHLPASRLVCEYGAVHHEALCEVQPARRSDFNLPEEAPVILWVGRLDPVKGFEEMLEAMALIRNAAPAHLLLAGEGVYREVISGLIQHHRLEQRIHLLGRRDDIPSLMKMSDVFLLSSRTEGLSNALLEAMAAGLPCVATDIPANREMIRHGENGILARARSGSSLAQGLLSVLHDPRWGRRLGRQASQDIRRYFDVGQWLTRWEARYKTIVSLPGCASAMGRARSSL